jgi:hypothetical protein
MSEIVVSMEQPSYLAARTLAWGCALCTEIDVEVLGLLLAGSIGQHMAGRMGLAWYALASKGLGCGWWPILR